jgi:hypothetical protein
VTSVDPKSACTSVRCDQDLHYSLVGKNNLMNSKGESKAPDETARCAGISTGRSTMVDIGYVTTMEQRVMQKRLCVVHSYFCLEYILLQTELYAKIRMLLQISEITKEH